MLLTALVLLLVAAGLLVTSFSTGETVWAWVSIGVSAVAAMALVVRWWRARRHRAAMSGRHRPEPSRVPVTVPDPAPAAGDEPPTQAETTSEFADLTSGSDGSDEGVAEDPTRETPVVPPADQQVTEETSALPPSVARDEVEPPEEDTDAADLLVVCEIDDVVVVVDERPRYHLADCRWLASRPVEPLPVREARELGFTPCARCGPDAELAGLHRSARVD